MTAGTDEELIRIKEDYLKILMQKYQAVYRQKSVQTSAADQISLNESSKQLEQQIQSIQAEINGLKTSAQSQSTRYRHAARVWEEELHRINFVEVEKVIAPIFQQLKRKEGSALFLLQEGKEMGGKWCMQKLRHQIETLGSLLTPCEVGFSAYQRADSAEFMNQMAARYLAEMSPTQADGQNRVQTVIDRIERSLISGCTFLMEIRLYTLTPQDAFLEWFVNDFWMPLTAKLPLVTAHRRRVRMIAVLSVQGSIPEVCLPHHLCGEGSDTHNGKFLELPLQRWTEVEICDWLFDHSGITTQPELLSDVQIERMASSIYAVTAGRPNNVYHELMDVLTQCAC